MELNVTVSFTITTEFDAANAVFPRRYFKQECVKKSRQCDTPVDHNNNSKLFNRRMKSGKKRKGKILGREI